MIKIICKSEKTTQQVKRCTIVSLCMWSEQNNQEETKSLYQTKQGGQPMIIGMSMYQTNIAMKYRKSDIWSPKSRWSIISMSQQNIQAYIKKLSMCNQETGTRWSTHQMSCLLHLKFKFDPLSSPVESPFCGPRISAQCVSHSMASSNFIFKNWFLLIIWKWLGVATYFCFIFKG